LNGLDRKRRRIEKEENKNDYENGIKNKSEKQEWRGKTVQLYTVANQTINNVVLSPI
jgi:hypothetical protein